MQALPNVETEPPLRDTVSHTSYTCKFNGPLKRPARQLGQFSLSPSASLTSSSHTSLRAAPRAALFQIDPLGRKACLAPFFHIHRSTRLGLMPEKRGERPSPSHQSLQPHSRGSLLIFVAVSHTFLSLVSRTCALRNAKPKSSCCREVRTG